MRRSVRLLSAVLVCGVLVSACVGEPAQVDISSGPPILADVTVIRSDVEDIVAQLSKVCPGEKDSATDEQLSSAASVATDLVNDAADFQAVNPGDQWGSAVARAGDFASAVIAVSHTAREADGACADMHELRAIGTQLLAELPPPEDPVVETTKVADGLTLTTIADPEGPQRIWTLTLDPDSSLSLDVGLARRSLGGVGPLTRIVQRAGAIAAVNGDYGSETGRPLHLFAADGELFQTSLINNAGRNVGFTQGADPVVYFGKPRVDIVATPPRGRTPIQVARWNDGDIGPDAIVGFTARADGVEDPPLDTCSVRLTPNGEPEWARRGKAIERPFVVAGMACRKEPMTLAGEGIVLAARRDGNRIRAIQAFEKGEHVRLSWSIGWPYVTDAIGGSALLIENGELATQKCHGGYECWRHPRTGIGVNAEGHVMLVVVDGRREGWSLGMRREEFADLMLELGAVDAMALDGGASSEMVVEGQVLNQPSGNEERRLMSAVLILPGPDRGEPRGLAHGPETDGPETDGPEVDED